jgi:hypothetical protein
VSAESQSVCPNGCHYSGARLLFWAFTSRPELECVFCRRFRSLTSTEEAAWRLGWKPWEHGPVEASP